MNSASNNVLSQLPGTAINHLPQEHGRYIGSPSIAILPDGTYVASHDIFGPGSTEHESGTTHVYSSADAGRTWRELCTLSDLFWAGLFVHGGALYILGTTRHHGLPVIRRSDDGGATWTQPVDDSTGLLASNGEYHTSTVPVIRHGGRIWRAIEDAGNGPHWGERYSPMVMSALENSDLLIRENWVFSNLLPHDKTWLGGKFGAWLEGNVVVAPDGQLVNILRVDFDSGDLSAHVGISTDGREIRFSEENFLPLPGGATKFTIRRDPIDGNYWALANIVASGIDFAKATHIRNTLALIRSADLRAWQIHKILLQHPDHKHHGFQYADWQFDGDDIVAAVRTAYDDGGSGAHAAHDANFLTFHRFSDFRKDAE